MRATETLVSPVPTSADRTASPEHTLRLLSQVAQVVQALGSRRHGSHTKGKLARIA
jgi:hypothetical protein